MDVRQRYIDEKLYNWNSVFRFTPRISNAPESVEDNGVSAKNFTIENFFRRDKNYSTKNFKICILEYARRRTAIKLYNLSSFDKSHVKVTRNLWLEDKRKLMRID